MAPIDKLSNAWKDFCQTVNHTLTAQVVKYCVDQRIGHLVYLQPVGSKRDSRYLSIAGKVEGRVDSTGWDWAQVATMLAYKCKADGIHLEVKKCDGPEEKKKAAHVRKVQSVPVDNPGKAKGRSRAKEKVV